MRMGSSRVRVTLAPLFYRELLDYFQELNTSSKYNNNDLILWNNKKITVEKNSLFWKRWLDRGIHFISDLLNSAENGFLTLDQFQNKFGFKINYLYYFQLYVAIPPYLKRKAFVSLNPDLLNMPFEYHKLDDRILMLPKVPCKSYYEMFNEKLVTEPTAVKSWKRVFPQFVNWKKKF